MHVSECGEGAAAGESRCVPVRAPFAVQRAAWNRERDCRLHRPSLGMLMFALMGQKRAGEAGEDRSCSRYPDPSEHIYRMQADHGHKRACLSSMEGMI